MVENQRNLILLGGPPGSGSTRLGKSLEQSPLGDAHDIAHVSIGNHIRHIGSGAIQSYFTDIVASHLVATPLDPLHDDVMRGIVAEALVHVERRRTILLDGYPRYVSQIEDTQLLAITDRRTIRGAIVTTTDTVTSLARMIKRGEKHAERMLTPYQAFDRLADHNATYPAMLTTLQELGYPIEHVPTDGPKSLTDELGLRALGMLLFQDAE